MRKKSAGFLELPRDILANRKLILNLSKNDFKAKFAGSRIVVLYMSFNQLLQFWYIGLYSTKR